MCLMKLSKVPGSERHLWIWHFTEVNYKLHIYRHIEVNYLFIIGKKYKGSRFEEFSLHVLHITPVDSALSAYTSSVHVITFSWVTPKILVQLDNLKVNPEDLVESILMLNYLHLESGFDLINMDFSKFLLITEFSVNLSHWLALTPGTCKKSRVYFTARSLISLN